MKKKYVDGEIVTGTVSSIENYGIFIKLDKYNSGLVHISSISNNFIKDLHDFAEVGETIRVKIVCKNSNGSYKLSIKNVDYRIMKRNGSKIKETPSGFKNLAVHLDYWVKKELSFIKK